MTYFKIVYMLSGKYKSTYRAKILLWENETLKIRDEDGKEHVLKEIYIKSLTKIKVKDNGGVNKEKINIIQDDQQTLF